MKNEVLIIADCDPRKKVIGGVGIYSYNLANYLTKNKVKIIFIGKKQDGHIITKFKNMRFIEATNKTGQSNYLFIKNLFKIAKNLNLDENVVINSQRPDWLVPFSKMKNKKIVTLHGSHSKNVYLKKGFIVGSIYDKLEEKGLAAADVIISVSEANTKYYKELYKKDTQITRKIITIPLGVDLSRFKKINKPKSRKKYGFKNSDKIVVYIGRLEKEKNLKLLIGACHKANVRLFIVGNGREEDDLKQFAKNLKSDTIFHDSVNNREVPNILGCGDVFALTSLYEGLPTVLIEALAEGLPILSTDVGDVRKLVINGKTGFIVNNKNIVARIKILMENSRKYKKNCIDKSKEYSWDKIGKGITQYY